MAARMRASAPFPQPLREVPERYAYRNERNCQPVTSRAEQGTGRDEIQAKGACRHFFHAALNYYKGYGSSVEARVHCSRSGPSGRVRMPGSFSRAASTERRSSRASCSASSRSMRRSKSRG